MENFVTFEKCEAGVRGIWHKGVPEKMSWDSVPTVPVVAIVEANDRTEAKRSLRVLGAPC